MPLSPTQSKQKRFSQSLALDYDTMFQTETGDSDGSSSGGPGRVSSSSDDESRSGYTAQDFSTVAEAVGALERTRKHLDRARSTIAALVEQIDEFTVAQEEAVREERRVHEAQLDAAYAEMHRKEDELRSMQQQHLAHLSTLMVEIEAIGETNQALSDELAAERTHAESLAADLARERSASHDRNVQPGPPIAPTLVAAQDLTNMNLHDFLELPAAQQAAAWSRMGVAVDAARRCSVAVRSMNDQLWGNEPGLARGDDVDVVGPDSDEGYAPIASSPIASPPSPPASAKRAAFAASAGLSQSQRVTAVRSAQEASRARIASMLSVLRRVEADTRHWSTLDLTGSLSGSVGSDRLREVLARAPAVAAQAAADAQVRREQEKSSHAPATAADRLRRPPTTHAAALRAALEADPLGADELTSSETESSATETAGDGNTGQEGVLAGTATTVSRPTTVWTAPAAILTGACSARGGGSGSDVWLSLATGDVLVVPTASVVKGRPVAPRLTLPKLPTPATVLTPSKLHMWVCAGSTIHLYDQAKGRKAATLSVDEGGSIVAALHLAWRRAVAVVSAARIVSIFDAKTFELRSTSSSEDLHRCAIVHRRLLYVGTQKDILVLEPRRGRVIRRLVGHDRMVKCLADGGDGADGGVWSGGADGLLIQWAPQLEATGGQAAQDLLPLRRIHLPTVATRLLALPTERLLIVGTAAGTVFTVCTGTGAVTSKGSAHRDEHNTPDGGQHGEVTSVLPLAFPSTSSSSSSSTLLLLGTDRNRHVWYCTTSGSAARVTDGATAEADGAHGSGQVRVESLRLKK